VTFAIHGYGLVDQIRRTIAIGRLAHLTTVDRVTEEIAEEHGAPGLIFRVVAANSLDLAEASRRGGADWARLR
jgi:hypothetical protein